MIRHIAVALAGVAVTVAGAAAPLVMAHDTRPGQASHAAAVHCQTELGGMSADPWAWTDQLVCQP